MGVRTNVALTNDLIRDEAGRFIKGWKRRMVEVIMVAYEALLDETEATESVDTGAYRSEHVIYHNGEILFEAAQRAGQRYYASRKQLGLGPIFPRPRLDDVRARVEELVELGDYTFQNDRPYADILENGSVRVEPRQIYATAAQVVEGYLNTLIAGLELES